jgi:DNA processing protein
MALIVETVDDILEGLGPLIREVKRAPAEPSVRHPAELAFTDQERSLRGHLESHPSGVDELIVRTGLTTAQVMATLSILELERLVRRLPGHQLVRA